MQIKLVVVVVIVMASFLYWMVGVRAAKTLLGMVNQS